ncbi:hypothetical protein [Ochrovirga pacifica]|uniref:hypothetical protein n=1 Tax=Ochrovirga pacifica TaxID=1042376 RepID=UPI0002558E4D|nr:hypothetical protein [Ochrovirga pacifica]
MQKKLEAELMSLAHSILKMKKGDDVKVLTAKAQKIYEQLAVLSFIETYVKETPQNNKTVTELVDETFGKTETSEPQESEIVAQEEKKESLQELQNWVEEETVEVTTTAVEIEKKPVNEPVPQVETVEQEKQPEPATSLTEVTEESQVVKETTEFVEEPYNLQASLEKELGTNVSLDMTTNLFENAQRITPKKSLNDSVMHKKGLQIDLNDRIAFVKYLFDNSQEDFNRVVSQLNTMESEKEALTFLKMIKKEYNWSGKEMYEERLLLLIDRKYN